MYHVSRLWTVTSWSRVANALHLHWHLDIWCNKTVNLDVCLCASRLRCLDITENPLTCTCDNAWFKTWAIHNAHTQVIQAVL